jgi:hypothetical protein
LLTLPSIIAGAAVLVALAAWLRARAAVRRLERLTESYWELRYESGQLKARVARLEVAAGLAEPEPTPQPRAASPTTFVPLTALKKNDSGL